MRQPRGLKSELNAKLPLQTIYVPVTLPISCIIGLKSRNFPILIDSPVVCRNLGSCQIHQVPL